MWQMILVARISRDLQDGLLSQRKVVTSSSLQPASWTKVYSVVSPIPRMRQLPLPFAAANNVASEMVRHHIALMCRRGSDRLTSDPRSLHPCIKYCVTPSKTVSLYASGFPGVHIFLKSA